MSNVLPTIDREMPAGFPSDIIWRTHERVTHATGTDAPGWSEFAGGWNGMAYRFAACGDADERFRASLAAHGEAPPAPERFVQETAIYEFFVTGLSSLECFAYGLHALGWLSGSPTFEMKSEDQQRGVTIASTAGRFAKVFPDAAVTDKLKRLREEPEFVQWSETRNYLAHRSTPGRNFSLVTGTDAPNPPASWWKLTINQDLTATRFAWLLSAHQELAELTHRFTTEKFEGSESKAVSK